MTSGVYPRTQETREKMRQANLGKKHKPETIKKMSGSNNHRWKGDNTKYRNIHAWMRKNYPKSKQCEYCGTKENVDIANMTGIYNRDFLNYRFLCRSCHQFFDYKKGTRHHRYFNLCK